MSNTASTFGFKHIGYISGSAVDYQLATRFVSSGNATNIYFGDPVIKIANSQYIQQAAAAATTSTIEGIFQGCMLIPSTGGAPTWSPYYPGAAGGDVTAYVINAPGALFVAAAFSTNISSTSIGNNIAFHTGAGSTFGGGFSGYTLDQATLGTATTQPFEIVGLVGLGQYAAAGIGSQNGADYTSAYNWVVVTFNNQRFKSLLGVA